MAQVKLVNRHVAIIRKKCVIIPEHVVRKRDHALAGKMDASRRDAAIFVVRHSAFFPVAMWVENCREGTWASPQRTVKISGQVKPGPRLKLDLFDAVTVAFDLPEYLRLQRCFFRQRPQAATDEHLLAN